MNQAATFPSRGTAQDVETGRVFMPKFDADGLIPGDCHRRR